MYVLDSIGLNHCHARMLILHTVVFPNKLVHIPPQVFQCKSLAYRWRNSLPEDNW